MENAIQDIAKNAGTISGEMILLLVLLSTWATERIYKITSQKKNGFIPPAAWNKKVDVDNCKEFRTRIGDESCEHRKNIGYIRKDITDIKEGVAYLKGKVGNGGLQ